MIELTLGEVADAVGAEPPPEAAASIRITGVVLDHRRAGAGDLFVAVAGERFDGHDFVAGAVLAGAVAAIVARPPSGPSAPMPNATMPNASMLVVSDPVLALGRLARAVIDRVPALRVVGVTGSAGKTTTKEMLAAVLADAGPTIAPEGNLNNEIGVPTTALRVTPDTRFLVAELGARGVGHVGYLARIVAPVVGVVLNVGSAHLGEFGSRAAIAQAKGELVEALPADGVAVLNADDPLVAEMAGRTAARVVRFGRTAPADVRAENVGLDGDAGPGCAAFDLVVRGGVDATESTGTAGEDRVRVRLGYVGEHQVANALAAAAAARVLGLDLAAIADSLSRARPTARWRMEVFERPDGVTVINDAYNASPDSVAAALRTLARFAPRRTVAVLGEMLELGEASTAEHERVGTLAVQLGTAVVVAVGAGGAVHRGALAAGAGALGVADEPDDDAGVRSTTVPDRQAATGLLDTMLRPGDVVLVKSSRDAGLRWLGDELAGRVAPDPDRPA